MYLAGVPSDRVELIVHRVDPARFRLFSELMPTVSYDGPAQRVTCEWSAQFGHEENWSARNARLLLDFAVDTILKVSGSEREKEEPEVFERDVLWRQRITAKRDGVKIWDLPRGRAGRGQKGMAARRRILLSLARGEWILGHVRQVEGDGRELCIESPFFPTSVREQYAAGYVLRDQVEVADELNSPPFV